MDQGELRPMSGGIVGRAAGFADRFLMFAACVAVTLMMLHVVADVLGKWLFNHPLPGTFETVEDYYMVALVFLPFAFVARTEGHIFVELFTRKLSPKKLFLLEAAVGVLTLAWMCLLLWYSGEEAIATTINNDLREIPGGYLLIWPARWFVPIGSAAMAVAVMLRIAQDVSAARRAA